MHGRIAVRKRRPNTKDNELWGTRHTSEKNGEPQIKINKIGRKSLEFELNLNS